MASFNSAVIARAAAALYDTQLGNASMTWALNAVDSVTYGGSVAALVQDVYNRDFKAMTYAQVAAVIVKNVGITTGAADASAYVAGQLAAAGAGKEGATIVGVLNAFAALTNHPVAAYNAAASAFNVQIGGADQWAQTIGSTDLIVHAPTQQLASQIFNLSSSTASGADVMHLTGGQDVRIDFTNPANQITGLDIDGDGVIEYDGVERSITGKAANFDVVDAYSRNPLNHNDIANNFIGDIGFDGSSIKGDGVSTNGNIFLGGLGGDTALGGVGNDFLVGGGVAQGRPTSVIDTLSGGRNADFFFAELSLQDATDGNRVSIDGGTTADNNSAGVGQSSQDADWLLFEASDDDEPVTIVLRDDSVSDPTVATPALGTVGGETAQTGAGSVIDQTGYVASRAGVAVSTLRDIENFDASGNLYGFLDKVDPSVQLGARAVDTRDVAAASNYGFGSSAQLRIVGSNVGNVIIGGYDNDFIQSADGSDLVFGGNMKQLLETVTGGVTNPNLAGIPNDGRDEIYAGAGNDGIVFEADGGIVDGDGNGPAAQAGAIANVGTGGNDTLWLTKYMWGTGTATSMVDAGKDAALAARFDLTAQSSISSGLTEGAANEGGAGFGGANVNGTADQTQYKSATFPASSPRVTVTGMDNIDATGLGAIDYYAAGNNLPELVFANHQNFDGYNGNLQLLGSQGENQLYAGNGDDIIEGRSGRDDLEGNGGKDRFYFSLDGDLAVGGTANYAGSAATGSTGAGAVTAVTGSGFTLPTGLASPAMTAPQVGDGVDIIRRKIDANGDGFWDVKPTATQTQNPTGSPFVWGQDFGKDSDTTTGASVLTIDIQKSGGNAAGTELSQVVNFVSEIVTGVKVGTTFTTISLNTPAIKAAATYAALTDAINAALDAGPFGADLQATLQSNGHTILISDTQGRTLADNASQVPGAGVSVNQIANTATQNTFAYGAAPTNTVQDVLIYKAYEDRSDNEGVDDDSLLGSSISLGNDAYAQDLVVSFQKDTSSAYGTGTTTYIAEDQRYEIVFDNLTTQDKVTVTVNGVKFSLQVGVSIDGTIVTNEDVARGAGTAADQATIQSNFLSRLATHITSVFADGNTAAGKVVAAASGNVLVLTQASYNTEETVFMRTPTVDVTDNSSGGQTATVTSINNVAQHEVQLYQFDGTGGKLNAQNVLFVGQEGVSRSVLATAAADGGSLVGFDAILIDSGSDDLQANVANATQLIAGSTSAVVNNVLTNTVLKSANFSVHGDDLLISGASVDKVSAGTGDDRVIGSAGSLTEPALVGSDGERLDGGRNYYAVKLVDELQARVYVLNAWEGTLANIATAVPELAGKIVSSVTPIQQTQTGTALQTGIFNDTLQYQQEDFGPAAKFTVTLDDYAVVAGVVQLKNDGAGLVSIDTNGDNVADSYARFTNFENVRTVSGWGAANAAEGQGNDTVVLTGLSKDTAGVSFDLTNRDTAGQVRYSVDAHSNGAGFNTEAAMKTILSGQALTNAYAVAGARPADGDFEALVMRVDGVENVITADGDDLLAIDETEAAKNNTFTAGLGEDRIVYLNQFADPGFTPAQQDQAEPKVTITVNTAANTDTVAMTGARVGASVTATDTLIGVEFVTLLGNTAQGFDKADVLNVAAVSGSTVNYNDARQVIVSRTSDGQYLAGTGVAASGTVRNSAGGIELTVENLFEIENVYAAPGSNDTVIVGSKAFMATNAREDSVQAGINLAEDKWDIFLPTYLDYDLPVDATTGDRIPFAKQTTVDFTTAINQLQFTFDLSRGASGSGGDYDIVDYSQQSDDIAAVVSFKQPVTEQYVLVGAQNLSLTDQGDRIDRLIGVEGVVASSGANSTLDLTGADRNLKITFSNNYNRVADYNAAFNAEYGREIHKIKVADGQTGTSLIGQDYIDYVFVDTNVSAANTVTPPANARWNRIEGSDFGETVEMSAYEADIPNTLNLRGGNNVVTYEGSRIWAEIDVNNTTGIITADVNHQAVKDNHGVQPDFNIQATDKITSYTAQNKLPVDPTVTNHLTLKATREAIDVVAFSNTSQAKTFVFGGVTDAVPSISVKVGTGTEANSLDLIGFEYVLDNGLTNDIYDFTSLATVPVTQRLFEDFARADHDTLVIGNQGTSSDGDAVANLNFAGLRSAWFVNGSFDFDVLDITKVDSADITSVTGVAGGEGTDEIIVGKLNKITSITGFESIVGTQDMVAQANSYTLDTTANKLNALTIDGTTRALSFGGTLFEGTFDPNSTSAATGAVTIGVVGSGNTYLVGGAGADAIVGGTGDDTIFGGAGDDVLSGGSGAIQNKLNVELTQELFGAFGGGGVFVDGTWIGLTTVPGDGNDKVGLAIKAYFAANPTATWAGVVPASVDYDSLNNYVVLSFNQQVGEVAATGPLFIADGGLGQVNAKEVTAYAQSGAGNDLIRGGVGKDTMSGGAGGDTFVLLGTLTAADNTAYVNAGPGIVTGLTAVLPYSELTGATRSASDVAAGETVSGGSGVDTLQMFGNLNITGLVPAGAGLDSIEVAVINSSVTMTVAELNSLTVLNFNGNVPHAIVITNNDGSTASDAQQLLWLNAAPIAITVTPPSAQATFKVGAATTFASVAAFSAAVPLGLGPVTRAAAEAWTADQIAALKAAGVTAFDIEPEDAATFNVAQVAAILGAPAAWTNSDAADIITLLDTGAKIATLSAAQLGSAVIDFIDASNNALTLSVAQEIAADAKLVLADTVTVLDTGANIAGMSVGQLSSAKIDVIDSSTNAVSLTVAQEVAADAKLVLADAVTVADTGAAIAGMSVGQLSSAKVDVIDATDNAISLTAAQEVAADAKLVPADVITVADTGANIAGLSAAQLGSAKIDTIDATDNAITLTVAKELAADAKLVVGDAITVADTGANIAAMTVPQLGSTKIDTIDATDNAISLTVAQEVTADAKLVVADAITVADTGANIAAMNVVQLGSGMIDTIDASDNAISLSVAQEAVADAKLVVADAITVADTGANIAGMSAAAMASTKIDTIDASDNTLSLTVAQELSADTKLVLADFVTVADTGANIATMTPAQMSSSKIDAIDATDDALSVTVAQEQAADAKLAVGDVVTLFDTGAAIGAASTATLGSTKVDTIDASDNVLTLNANQFLVAEPKLVAGDDVTLADLGAFIGALSAAQLGSVNLDHVDATDNVLSLDNTRLVMTIGKLTAADAVTASDTGANLVAAGVGALGQAEVDVIDATDNVLTLDAALAAVTVTKLTGADTVTLSDTGANIAAQGAAVLGNGNLDVIDATDDAITLTAVQEVVADGKLVLGDAITVADAGANIAAMAAGQLGSAKIDTIDATDNAITLTVFQELAADAKLVAGDMITIADSGAIIAGLTVGQLGSAKLDVIDAIDNAITLSALQEAAADALLVAGDVITVSDTGANIAAMATLTSAKIDVFNATDNAVSLTAVQFNAIPASFDATDALTITSGAGADVLNLNARGGSAVQVLKLPNVAAAGDTVTNFVVGSDKLGVGIGNIIGGAVAFEAINNNTSDITTNANVIVIGGVGSITTAAALIAADATVTGTNGLIVIRNGANTEVWFSDNLAADGTETLLCTLVGINDPLNLTAPDFGG